MAGKKQGSSPKGSRFGSTQKNGKSRFTYFQRRKMGLAAANKAKAKARAYSY